MVNLWLHCLCISAVHTNYFRVFTAHLQILSRSKPAASGQAPSAGKEKKKRKFPRLEEFLQNRDYVGAITLLEVSGKLSRSAEK